MSTQDAGEMEEATFIDEKKEEDIPGTLPEIETENPSEGNDSIDTQQDTSEELSQVAIGDDGQSEVTYGKHARRMAEFRRAHNR